VYKVLDKDSPQVFHVVLTSISKEEEMSQDFRVASTVVLYKNSGNYSISLFSIAGHSSRALP
jgi:hypothetical protein